MPNPRLDQLIQKLNDLRDRGESVSLEDLCRDCPELIPELRKRIDEATASLESGQEESSSPRVAEAVGDVIGPYTLRQILGEGGMGSVWVADQSQPVRRQVALKLIKAGMDSARFLARFAAEKQALAVMDHPNIAKVLDAGTTNLGRPYFVMELVKGIPITRYCDREKLSPRERLELFVPVCQAVQHAHQKGIIHRDLKPSNILVGVYDGKAIPKVIDFGVAKATGPKLTEQSMFTEVGAIIGTLEYMAPEQAELDNIDIDTRADIYSLGVVLYELLAGSPPFSRRQLQNRALDEMLRLIREVEPPKPSTKLSSSDELPNLAAVRKLEPKRLTSQVRGELDWIVMKCLEKERARRYETANGLAADIGRYLSDEPVVAGPPSKAYRLRKFVRRNRGAVLAASLIALALIAGTAGTAWGWITARNHADAESKAREVAQQRERETRRTLQFVENRILAAPRPERQQGGLGYNVPFKAVLEAAVPHIGTDFKEEPLIEARLRMILGQSFYLLSEIGLSINQCEAARAILNQTSGPDHADTLACCETLASSYFENDRWSDALALREDILARRRATLGPDHVDSLRSVLPIAAALARLKRLPEALKMTEETLPKLRERIGPNDLTVLMATNNLAGLYFESGQPAKAVELCEQSLERTRAQLGNDHPETLSMTYSLALGYEALGRLEEAAKLGEQTVKLRTAKLGAEHRDTLRAMHNLAVVYEKMGRGNDVIRIEEEMLAISKKKYGPKNQGVLTSMFNVANAYTNVDRYADALTLFEETLALQKETIGAGHPDTLETMIGQARCLEHLGRGAEGLKVIDECLKLAEGKEVYPATVPVAMSVRIHHFGTLKDVTGCRETAKMWDDFRRTDPESFYTAACIHAVTADVIRTSDKSEAGAKAAEEESTRAVDWLKKAIVAGFDDMARIKDDPDLKTIREREEVKKLLAEKK